MRGRKRYTLILDLDDEERDTLILMHEYATGALSRSGDTGEAFRWYGIGQKLANAIGDAEAVPLDDEDDEGAA